MRRDLAECHSNGGPGRRRRRIWRILAAAGLVVSGCSTAADTVTESAATPSAPATVDDRPEPDDPPAEAATPTPVPATPTPPPSPISEEQLTELAMVDLDRLGNAPGQIVSVLQPSRGLDLTVAVGAASIDGTTPLTVDATVRLTSVTKTYVAAATFRLVESGAIALDDSIAAAGVSDELLELLRSDGYDVEMITVGQLMAHTSGIADYAGSSDYTAAPYSTRNIVDPDHEWTREEQVRFAVDEYDPMAEPGQEFHYSDTNYILLGDLLERSQESSLGEALRTLIGAEVFGPDTTHFELLEPTPPGAGPRAGQYFGTFDARDASPTIDLYGGGGLVASMPETARFFHALGTGGLFDDPETFDRMSTVTEPGAAVGAASGLFRQDFDGVECFGHSGFYGTFAMVCPEIDLAMSRAWNQALLPDGADLQLLAEEIVSLAR